MGTDLPLVLDTVERLSAGDILERDEPELVATLGQALCGAGLPVDRVILHRRTLHPDILARAIAWAPHEPVEIYDRDHGLDLSENFTGSPLQQAMETGWPVVIHLEPAHDVAWAWSLVLRNRKLVELVILPLGTSDGPISTLSVGTARAGGFAARDREILDRIAPGLIDDLRPRRG